MNYVRDLNGVMNPHIKRYAIGGTFSNAGLLVESPNGDDAGVTAPSTTVAADVCGVSLDTATYVTAQQTDGTSAQRYLSIVINPMAIYAGLMSGGATEGTALTLYDVTTASATGTAVTTGDEWSCPTFDEGVVWGYDGANAGQYRKITSVSSTAGTVTVPFDYDTVVGDNFMRAPYWPADAAAITVQFTTALYQADASIAVGTGAAAQVVEMVLNDASNSGRTNSWVYFMSRDNVWNLAT